MSFIDILEEIEIVTKGILSLAEGDIIDFQKKRKEIVLDRNAHKLANMMKNGELSGIRVNKGGELMGDPVAIKKVKDIEKENREVGLGRKVGLD